MDGSVYRGSKDREVHVKSIETKFIPGDLAYFLDASVNAPVGPISINEMTITITCTEKVVTYYFGSGPSKIQRREPEVFATHEEAIIASRPVSEKVPITFSQEMNRRLAIEGSDPEPTTRLLSDSVNRKSNKR